MIAMAVLSALLVTYASAIGGCDRPGGCPPSVTSTVPTDGKTRVDRDRNIEAQFWSDSGSMKKSTINGQTFKLYAGSLTREQLNTSCDTSGCPQAVSATVTYDSETDLSVLNPDARLAKRTVYTALVEGAGDSDGLAAKDINDVSIASDVIWDFKTGRK
jgi:hypothetical protein